MKLNNKGFAITGILYTVFILFLLIITSVLAGLQLKRTMLERSILLLEDSYIGENLYESEAGKEKIKNINKTKSGDNDPREAPVTGKYIFNIRNNFYSDAETKDFPYNDNCGQDSDCAYTFTAGKKGYYKLEVWGASGGDGGPNSGGKGGYSSGVVHLNANETLYVVVGGKGNSLSNAAGTAFGGYNGGGDAAGKTNKIVGSGGGATDIRTSSNYHEYTSIPIDADANLYYGPYLDTGAGGHYQVDIYGSNLNNCSYQAYDNNNWEENGGVYGEWNYYNIYYSSGTSNHWVLYVNVNLASVAGLEIAIDGPNKCSVSKEVFTKLDDRIIVAGGGGGSAYESADLYGYGGAGGGTNGNSGFGSDSRTGANVGSGGTQDAGGTQNAGVTQNAGSFGKGGSSGEDGTGGGGGYYGGGAGNWFTGGGGGSGYVSPELINATTIAGSQNIPEYPKQDEGNGYARISYYGEDAAYQKGLTTLYGFTGAVQTFKALNNGKYKIEAWGAQGGGGAGKGGYTSGYINLENDEVLYVYVGGEGGANNTFKNDGGWNGGGVSGFWEGVYSYGGGGSTDIRLTNATSWNDTISLRNRIMVAAGGGGGFSNSTYSQKPGVGGGLVGGTGTGNYPHGESSGGGTQTGPGSANSPNLVGSFGYASNIFVNSWGGGGGGGYWGGSTGFGRPGGGGSSFVSGYDEGAVAINEDGSQKDCTTDPNCSHHYSGKVFENPKIYDGGSGFVRSPVSTDYMTGNSGDGYAKITYMGNGDVKVNDITCVAYLTKDTPIDFEHITFLTADCNDAKNNSLFAFDQNLTDQDYNVITLAAVYSFER